MQEKKNGIERRDFFKASGAVLGGAVLTAANFSEAWAQPPAAPEGKKPQMPQDAEPAVAYGQVHNPEMLGDAFNAMVQIHGITRPYQHKFNDALVKAHLSYLEFLIKSGKDKEYLQFDLAFLSPLFKRVKGRAKKAGKDYVLTGMFEGTGCSFLLYEKIYKRPNERLIVCPFREGIGHNKFLKTTLTIEDVCNKYCIPRWTGHGKACGVEVKVKTGEICSIKIS
jgi:hypothetical protein